MISQTDKCGLQVLLNVVPRLRWPEQSLRARSSLHNEPPSRNVRLRGTYVTDQGSPLARRERMKILADRVDQMLAEAGNMNVPFEDLLKLVQQRYSVLSASRTKESKDD